MCVVHTLRCALETGRGGGWLELFRSTSMPLLAGSTMRWFTSSTLWELEVLCCLCWLTQFLSNYSQYVVVDGCRSKLVNVVSRLRSASGKCLGPAVVPPVHRGTFLTVENCYVDDSTFGSCCHPQVRELLSQSHWIVIWIGLVCGVTCWEWYWMRVRLW